MPYVGAKLANLFDPVLSAHAAHRMAETGQERLLTLVKVHTPVSSGELKESWKVKIVIVRPGLRGGLMYEGGVWTEVDYAPYVEHGTGLWGPKHAKYLIVPKKPGGVLHWIGHGGEDVFAAKVMHPGSPGAHMVAIAVGELESTLPLVLDPELHRWVHEQEVAAEFKLGGLGR